MMKRFLIAAIGMVIIGPLLIPAALQSADSPGVGHPLDLRPACCFTKEGCGGRADCTEPLKEEGPMDETLRKARHFFNQKDFQLAQENYEAYLKNPSDRLQIPEALYESGRAFVPLGHYDKALAQWKRVSTEFPASPLAPESLMASGNLEIGMGRWDSAVQHFREIIARFPSSPSVPTARYSLVDIEFIRTSFDPTALSRAIAELKSFRQVYPNDERGRDMCKWLGIVLEYKAQEHRTSEQDQQNLKDVCGK